jgi:two-component system, OmpR family, response regulator
MGLPMKTQQHIVIVDKDPSMRAVVSDYLVDHGFEVSRAANAATMKRILAARPTDLIILDLHLGEENGLDIVQNMKEDSPPIIVTGLGIDEIDKVVCLELGADDYVTKPIGLREMLARVRAILRRVERPCKRPEQKLDRSTYSFAGWKLAMKTRTLTTPRGGVMRLTLGEFNLLSAFVRSPQHILTREQLMTASRVRDHEVFDRSIDVQVLRLRRKLDTDPARPSLIQTERGIGYVFCAPVELTR